MQLLRISLLISLLVISHISQAWELHQDEDNVQIYQKHSENSDFEVKATTVVKASVGSLLRLFDDTNVAPLWIDRCRRVELLEWFGNEKRLVHTYFSSPWPLQDRDMVTLANIEISDDEAELNIQIVDKGKERQLLPHYTRMQEVKGHWRAERLDSGRLRITYIGSGDAGGNVPGWLSNRLLLASTHNTFVNLRKMVVLDKYQ